MATPSTNVVALKLRKDIWTHFPVNLDSMGRGNNSHDRYGVEWHNMKVRQIADAKGMTPEQVKKDIFPRLMASLLAASAWSVEEPLPGSRFIAVIAMKFAEAPSTRPVGAPNRTRKNVKPNNNRLNFRKNMRINTRKNVCPNNRGCTTCVSRWNKPANRINNSNRNKNRLTVKATSNATSNAAAAGKNVGNARQQQRNITRKNLTGDALVRKVNGILNKIGDANMEKLTEELVALQPATEADKVAMATVIFDRIQESAIYQPFYIQLLKRLPWAPEMVERMLGARLLEEPIAVKMEIQAEEHNNAGPLNEDKVNKQLAYFKGATLFAGYMYREGLYSAGGLQQILQHFKAQATDADGDYRLQDAGATALLYILIRAGPRLETEIPAVIAEYKTLITSWTTTWPRQRLKILSGEFLAAAAEGYVSKEGMPWALGAPKAELVIRQHVPVAPVVPKEGLGADIGELWRRFPLDVKQQGPMWVVRIHGKKLAERFAKESAKYKTQKDLEAFVSKRVLDLIDNSTHWARGPIIPGTLVTVVPTEPTVVAK